MFDSPWVERTVVVVNTLDAPMVEREALVFAY